MIMTERCPSDESVERFLRSELDATTDAAIDVHLSSCDACCRRLAKLTAFEQSPHRTVSLRHRTDDDFPRITKRSGSTPKFLEVELLKQIGSGGFGTVYLAKQTNANDRIVAVKIAKRQSRQSSGGLDGEVASLVKVDHVNVARIHQTCRSTDGTVGIVMEHIHGKDLSTIIKNGELTTCERWRLADEICAALIHVHSKHIVHRDLKPANILVTTNSENQLTVKLIDFGLATVVDAASPTAHRGMGTIEFMPPEQAECIDASISVRSDIYSLGLVLFELFGGRRIAKLREGESESEYFTRKFSTDFRLPSLVKPDRQNPILSKVQASQIDRVIEIATSVNPLARYVAVEELRRDLSFVAGNRPITFLRRNWLRRFRLFVKLSLRPLPSNTRRGRSTSVTPNL